MFTTVALALREKYGDNIFVSGEYVEIPARFPAVSLTESDNRVFERMRTTEIENAVQVMYEMHVWSNKTSGKKSEAKEIANLADGVMEEMGFTRTFRSPVPNLNNASIFQLICRYEAVIDKDHWIYQN